MKKSRRIVGPPPDTFGPVCERCGDEIPAETAPIIVADKRVRWCAECRADWADAQEAMERDQSITPVRRF